MKKHIMLLAYITINLFGADDARLKLLAREHSNFVVGMVKTLNESPIPAHTLKSVLIRGSSRNGKESLAREIAAASQRTCNEHRLSTITNFQEFITEQIAVQQPHVTVVKNVHLIQNKTFIEDSMKDLRENKQVFLIGIGDQKRMHPDLMRLFDYKITLNDPTVGMRRQILEHYLAQETMATSMLDYFATHTERVSSGKLCLLTHQLLQRASGNIITHELFEDINAHIARSPTEPVFGAREFGMYYGPSIAAIIIKSAFTLLRYKQTRGWIGEGAQREFDIELLRLTGELIITGLHTFTK